MRKDLKILFLGTPEFAATSLRALVEGGYNVVGVVTAPDKPAGRGQHLQQSEVKKYAVEAGLRVFQPEKLRAPEFLAEIADLKPDLGIVIAFRMLPEVLWSLPRLGTFNLHASLLPQYRGAAPINRAIMNGETVTGLTTFMLNAEIDKGDIIGRVEMPILPTDNAGTLHDRMMVRGATLVTETVDAIATGRVTPLSQMDIPEDGLKPAPKIFRDDCRVDWSRPGTEIVNFIRGLSPYPAAWTEFGDTTIKLFDAEFHPAEGWVSVRELQPAGKRRMTAKEFFNGLKG
jgi:methionyl-tRNA formyltransferase